MIELYSIPREVWQMLTNQREQRP